MSEENSIQGPHQGQPVLFFGEPLKTAHAAMILVHGRGASAEDILFLAREFPAPGFAYLAPQAAGHEWYPFSFMAPLESNEPGLSSALAVIASLLSQIAGAGIPSERTILLGFSQGACLSLEFAARNARRYGGIVGLSGGLIGPSGTPRDYPGSLENTPVFLGCSEKDPHIPRPRVELSAQVLQHLGGNVTLRFYPNLTHTVNRDEVRVVQEIVKALHSSA